MSSVPQRGSACARRPRPRARVADEPALAVLGDVGEGRRRAAEGTRRDPTVRLEVPSAFDEEAAQHGTERCDRQEAQGLGREPRALRQPARTKSSRRGNRSGRTMPPESQSWANALSASTSTPVAARASSAGASAFSRSALWTSAVPEPATARPCPRRGDTPPRTRAGVGGCPRSRWQRPPARARTRPAWCERWAGAQECVPLPEQVVLHRQVAGNRRRQVT